MEVRNFFPMIKHDPCLYPSLYLNVVESSYDFRL